MKRLIIAGAGGFGREVCEWASQARENGRHWRIGGFVDDNPAALEGFPGFPPILGAIGDCEPLPGDLFLCALGSPRLKREVTGRLLSKGARFAYLIHPTAVLGRNVRIGVGSIICPFSTLTCDVTLGDHVTLNVGSSVGHGARIGSWSTLSGHCDVTGEAVLEEEVFMGSHASVLPGVKVGYGATIGAGAVAFANVPAETTLASRPSIRIN